MNRRARRWPLNGILKNETAMDVHIREQALPGIGHRYELSLGHRRWLAVIVRKDGGREIDIGSDHADEPDATATLTQEQAVAIASVLTGARFSLDTSDDRHVDADEVNVETVTLTARSPAIGRMAGEIPLLHDSDASVLAVIRDETPDLIEDTAKQPCQAGDRVVVAARRDRLAEVVQHLAG